MTWVQLEENENFTTQKEIEEAFECTLPPDIEILYASYTYEDYSGSALILYRSEGKIFEVNGSHCSCNGLEGQWEPEETTKEALMMRKRYDEQDKFWTAVDSL